MKADENTAEVDLGFGILTISFNNNEIKYRFKPSNSLEKSISNTVINERNDLALHIENSLISKLTNVYKSFF